MQGTDTDRVKQGDRDYSVQCADCGNWFEATRSDASYCSPKCRKHAHRAPIRKRNAIIALQMAGRSALSTAVRYKKSDEVYQEMLKLQKQINAALALFETENNA